MRCTVTLMQTCPNCMGLLCFPRGKLGIVDAEVLQPRSGPHDWAELDKPTEFAPGARSRSLCARTQERVTRGPNSVAQQQRRCSACCQTVNQARLCLFRGSVVKVWNRLPQSFADWRHVANLLANVACDVRFEFSSRHVLRSLSLDMLPELLATQRSILTVWRHEHLLPPCDNGLGLQRRRCGPLVRVSEALEEI